MQRVIAVLVNGIKNRGILGLRWNDERLASQHTSISNEPGNRRWNNNRACYEATEGKEITSFHIEEKRDSSLVAGQRAGVSYMEVIVS